MITYHKVLELAVIYPAPLKLRHNGAIQIYYYNIIIIIIIIIILNKPEINTRRCPGMQN